MRLLTWSKYLCIAYFFITFLPAARAASTPLLQAEIDELKAGFAGNVAQVRAAIDKAEWTGMTDPAVFEPVAERLKAGYQGTSAPELELNSWLAKALALSGDAKYRPLFEEILVSQAKGKLKRHVETAKERLAQFERWNPVIAKDNHLATSREELAILRVANMIEASDPELSSAGIRRVYHAYLDKPALLDKVNQKLLAEYKTEGSAAHLDALAWACRTLGESGASQYKSTLEQIEKDKATPKKIARYAKKYNKVL